MGSPPNTEIIASSPPKMDVFQEIEDDIDHVMQKIESQQKKNEQLQQRVRKFPNIETFVDSFFLALFFS